MIADWKQFEGQVFQDKFPLQRLLGSTSHSAVFLTQSPPPQPKTIAIKFISSSLKADSQTSLLHRASQLRHPHLLRLLPGGHCRLAGVDLVFGVMEYVDQDLGQVLPNRPLSESEAHEMLGPLVDALSYIHSKGFAHSHIKPSNIMAIGDQVKLSSDAVLPLGERRPGYRPLDTYDAPEAGSKYLRNKRPFHPERAKPIQPLHPLFPSPSLTSHSTVCVETPGCAGPRLKSRIVSMRSRARPGACRRGRRHRRENRGRAGDADRQQANGGHLGF